MRFITLLNRIQRSPLRHRSGVMASQIEQQVYQKGKTQDWISLMSFNRSSSGSLKMLVPERIAHIQNLKSSAVKCLPSIMCISLLPKRAISMEHRDSKIRRGGQYMNKFACLYLQLHVVISLHFEFEFKMIVAFPLNCRVLFLFYKNILYLFLLPKHLIRHMCIFTARRVCVHFRWLLHLQEAAGFVVSSPPLVFVFMICFSHSTIIGIITINSL